MSDDAQGVTVNGGDKTYTYKPSYLNDPELKNEYAFLLNADGNSYVKDETNTTVAKVTAFRPYFTVASASNGGTRATARSIVFGSYETELKGVEEHGDPRKEEINGGLRIWTKKDKIFVESTLSFTEDVRVVTPAGITVASFSVKSGQTVEVQADFSGIYVVHTLDGRYIKKLSVKK